MTTRKWSEDFVNKVICGDCFEVMKNMPDESVDMVMTSPPYWGLRDYGIEQIFGGDKDCEHEWGNQLSHPKQEKRTIKQLRSSSGLSWNRGENASIFKWQEYSPKNQGNFCLKCQAWRGQLGLEPTPEMYIKHLTEIFNEAKRVLKKAGTLWLNIGDTYGGSSCGRHDYRETGSISPMALFSNKDNPQQKIMPKCLLMIPERLVWSLIQNGWILRNKIIWYKPNSMPSSVKDRFSNRYEFIYMFAKAKERKLGYQNIAEIERAWLAALIDGEGTIGIAKAETNYQTYLYVGNTNKNLIDTVENIIGLKNNKTSKKLKSGKTIWIFRISAKKAINIIKQIYPYLIAKKEQAKVAIALQEMNKYRGDNRYHKNLKTKKEINEQLKLYELIKSLNQGNSEYSGLPGPDLTLPQKYHGCEKYYFDLDAVREPHKYDGRKDTLYKGGPKDMQIGKHERWPDPAGKNPGDVINVERKWDEVPGQITQSIARDHGGWYRKDGSPIVDFDKGKNPGDFWNINTQPFPEAHFAVFPETLCEKPIKAGCPEQVCKRCGKARERIIEPTKYKADKPFQGKWKEEKNQSSGSRLQSNLRAMRKLTGNHEPNFSRKTIGWSSCNCNAGFEGGIVLDPFAGAGTVGVVAKKLGRQFFLIDIKKEYCEMAERRISKVGYQMELRI